MGFAARQVVVAVLLAGALSSGCLGCSRVGPGKPDAGGGGPPKPVLDSGHPGFVPDELDGGTVYPDVTSAEPCAPDLFPGALLPDGGAPAFVITDAGVTFGLCVATRHLSGIATLNGAPTTAPVTLTLKNGEFQSEATRAPGGDGRYDVDVLKGRYELMLYHPTAIFPSHQGGVEIRYVDLRKDATQDATATSWPLRGGVTFAGLPFVSSVFPPDVTLDAYGIPPMQHASVASQGGAYEVSMLEGVFAVWLTAPASALGGTELTRFPVDLSVTLNAPRSLDIHIPVADLEGELRVDGQPFPNRNAGPDYTLEFVAAGGQEATVRSYHEGGVPTFHSYVPKGKYSVNLRLEDSTDKQLPSMLFNKQLAAQVDLTAPRVQNFSLTTVNVEGGIVIDGQPMTVVPGQDWTMYMYGFPDVMQPWSLAYYEVPMDSASFNLRVFPASYQVLLYLTDNFGPDFPEGWYLVNRFMDIRSNTKLPINIETGTLDGRLLVDGAPPPVGTSPGTMVFRSSEGVYRKRVLCTPDGSFRVRLPRAAYDVSIILDRQTYPAYASGRQRLLPRLDLTNGSKSAELRYDTVRVTGPLRVGGKVVANVLGGDDVGLRLERVQDHNVFDWGFPGGTDTYDMRIPKGDYEITFRIERDAIPDTAFGTAPFGVTLPAFLPGTREDVSDFLDPMQ